MYSRTTDLRAWIVSLLLLFLVSEAFLLFTGVSPRVAVVITLIIFFQGLGGALVWRCLNPRAQILESIGFGLALGTVLSVLAGLMGQVFFDSEWGWIFPPLLALSLFLIRRASRCQLVADHTG